MTTKKILICALERLEKHWSQNVGYGDPITGDCCAVGAIAACEYEMRTGNKPTWEEHFAPRYNPPEIREAIMLIAQNLRKESSHLVTTNHTVLVTHWNDLIVKNKKEVLACFEKVIKEIK